MSLFYHYSSVLAGAFTLAAVGIKPTFKGIDAADAEVLQQVLLTARAAKKAQRNGDEEQARAARAAYKAAKKEAMEIIKAWEEAERA